MKPRVCDCTQCARRCVRKDGVAVCAKYPKIKPGRVLNCPGFIEKEKKKVAA
jgi:hypothetical protein